MVGAAESVVGAPVAEGEALGTVAVVVGSSLFWLAMMPITMKAMTNARNQGRLYNVFLARG